MGRIGYDKFFTRPGEVDEMTCNVCGDICNVTRDAMGATSFAAALGRHETLHDSFECPHREEIWHQTALRLVEAIESTPSKRLAELMRLDLEDTLKERMNV